MKKKIVNFRLGMPYPSTRKDKKLMVFVLNPKTKRVKTIHFGQRGYQNNYSKTAWEKYMKRSEGIKDRYGRKTKDNPLSANYWARKILWNGKKWRNK